MLEGSCPVRFCHLDQATLVVGVLEMNVECDLQMVFAQCRFFCLSLLLMMLPPRSIHDLRLKS